MSELTNIKNLALDLAAQAMALANDKLKEQQATIARLLEGLEYYADDENWKARAALNPESENFTGGPAKELIAKYGRRDQ